MLSYNQYTLQNTRFADDEVPYLMAKGVGIMNAGPFSARLLTNAPLPVWLKEPESVKAARDRPRNLRGTRLRYRKARASVFLCEPGYRDHRRRLSQPG